LKRFDAFGHVVFFFSITNYWAAWIHLADMLVNINYNRVTQKDMYP